MSKAPTVNSEPIEESTAESSDSLDQEYDIDAYNITRSKLPKRESLLRGRKFSINQIVIDGKNRCSSCGFNKDTGEFRVSSRSGLTSACRDCLLDREKTQYNKKRQAKLLSNGGADGRTAKSQKIRLARGLGQDEEWCKVCGPKPRVIFSKSGTRDGEIRYKPICNDCRKLTRPESIAEPQPQLRSTNILQYKDEVIRLHDDGLTIIEIHKQINVNRDSVSKLIKSNCPRCMFSPKDCNSGRSKYDAYDNDIINKTRSDQEIAHELDVPVDSVKMRRYLIDKGCMLNK